MRLEWMDTPLTVTTTRAPAVLKSCSDSFFKKTKPLVASFFAWFVCLQSAFEALFSMLGMLEVKYCAASMNYCAIYLFATNIVGISG